MGSNLSRVKLCVRSTSVYVILEPKISLWSFCSLWNCTLLCAYLGWHNWRSVSKKLQAKLLRVVIEHFQQATYQSLIRDINDA